MDLTGIQILYVVGIVILALGFGFALLAVIASILGWGD